MINRTVRLGAAVIVTVGSFVLVGCSGLSTSPSQTIAAVNVEPVAPVPVPTTVIAPAPPGVSPEVWHVGFLPADDKLYRPDALHYDVSGFGSDVRSAFAEMAAVAAESVQQKTTFDLVPGGVGATISVTIVPGLLCSGRSTVGCTTLSLDPSGKIIGGRIEFNAIATIVSQKPVVLHEIYRTLGLMGTNPKLGIMSNAPWNQTRPTDEEQKMLLARYEFPLLAVFGQ